MWNGTRLEGGRGTYMYDNSREKYLRCPDVNITGMKRLTGVVVVGWRQVWEAEEEQMCGGRVER